MCTEKCVLCNSNNYTALLCSGVVLLRLQALAVIQQMALSAAIFAPGWVFETQEKAQFFLNQDRSVHLLTSMF